LLLGFRIAVKEKVDDEIYTKITANDGKYKESKKKDKVGISRF